MSKITEFYKPFGVLKTQEFTTSGTFTVPEGVNVLTVSMCGGGGGFWREAYYSVTFQGGPGGGGFYENHRLVVTPGDVLTITVGAGGSSAIRTGPSTTYPPNRTRGTPGGTTSIANGATMLLQAYGGTDGGYNMYGGSGGWPNGAGGAFYASSGTMKAGMRGTNKSSSVSSASAGGYASTVGQGIMGGQIYSSPGKTPFGTYGCGASGSGSPTGSTSAKGASAGAFPVYTYNSTTQTPGEPGIVIISYFGV